MHPRNPYQHTPNFTLLARDYPDIQPYLTGNTLDFQDDAAQRALTQALLHRDFNLTIDLPPNRLCPPVPNRLNYVLWIQDIVMAYEGVLGALGGGEGVGVCGVDIGTGASAIYPLLACSLEPKWQFLATELDFESYKYACANVQKNGLEKRIHVVKLDPDPNTRTRPQIEFTMCNPPFYGSVEEVEASSAMKEGGPLGVCTGAPVEMITPGGEAQFVGRMVKESVGGGVTLLESWNGGHLEKSLPNEGKPTSGRRNDREFSSSPGKRHLDGPGPSVRFGKRRRVSESGIGERTRPVRWYTSMLGKMGSVVEVVKELGACGISNYAITEFVQGQTRRWAVGWSCGGFRLPDSISRIQNPNPTLQRLMPSRNALQFHHLDLSNLDLEQLQEILQTIDGCTQGDTNPGTPISSRGPCLFMSAMGDTWSRSARRERKMKMQAHSGSESGFALVCSITWTREGGGGLEVRWVYGFDRALFESFASHVARKLGPGKGAV
ncbi:hypothetical protein BDZ94DRAFT_1200963 [Collybia nuda]|uniref:U6 small nuclear RNA (adenine-(43)-N(6))-methyltransferase n=1 Tax=Collybia nuda TaxID=64659 RepID=A0A9P5XZH5_9AGAR|nr:hypothetical protein BDZ94DRAFT_1200963 [Collybia nuda]